MTATIASLPYELKLHIFSFLNDEELTNIATVSKEWNKISSTNFLWQRHVESLISEQKLNNPQMFQNEKKKIFYFRLMKEIQEKIKKELEESQKTFEETNELLKRSKNINDMSRTRINYGDEEPCTIL